MELIPSLPPLILSPRLTLNGPSIYSDSREKENEDLEGLDFKGVVEEELFGIQQAELSAVGLQQAELSAVGLQRASTGCS